MKEELSSKEIPGGVCAPQGFKASGVACGIKGDDQLDLAVVLSEKPAAVAGVFTTNRVKAAPVVVSQERVKQGRAQAVVINSGGANAVTGGKGIKDAKAMTAAVAGNMELEDEGVLVCSTGIIGKLLPMKKVVKGIDKACKSISNEGNLDAAKAIMTTDSVPKESATEIDLGPGKVRIGGMAKGAGMINPRLATMLSVITTDAFFNPVQLSVWLSAAAEWSFNRISVDGETSTNDTVLLLANGAAWEGEPEISQEDEELFFEGLCWVLANLAMSIVEDGEGTTKVVKMVVEEALSDADAIAIARSVANSNLVKCMLFGEQLIWGRLVQAAGESGAEIATGKLSLSVGEELILKDGKQISYDVDGVEEYLKRESLEIRFNLGIGDGSGYILGTDLTSDYVKLNAEKEN